MIFGVISLIVGSITRCPNSLLGGGGFRNDGEEGFIFFLCFRPPYFSFPFLPSLSLWGSNGVGGLSPWYSHWICSCMGYIFTPLVSYFSGIHKYNLGIVLNSPARVRGNFNEIVFSYLLEEIYLIWGTFPNTLVYFSLILGPNSLFMDESCGGNLKGFGFSLLSKVEHGSLPYCIALADRLAPFIFNAQIKGCIYEILWNMIWLCKWFSINEEISNKRIRTHW